MRNAIKQYLSGHDEATAKQIADATGFEQLEVTQELNAMLKDAEVERAKRHGAGPAYFYWLAQPVAAASNEIPVFGGPAEQPDISPAGGGAHNAGSSGTDSPNGTTSSPVAAAIIPENIHAEHARELQAALEHVDELRGLVKLRENELTKATIELTGWNVLANSHGSSGPATPQEIDSLIRNLRAECNNLEFRQRAVGDFTIGEIVIHLQKLLPEDVHLHIESDAVLVYDDKHDEEYTADPDGVLPLLDAISLIRRRKVA